MNNRTLQFILFVFITGYYNVSAPTVKSFSIHNSNKTQAETMNLTFGSNFRIFPDTVVQVETSVYCNPNNPLTIAAAAITDYYPGGYTMGFYKSTNGGYNWSGTEAIRTTAGTVVVTVGDPSIVIDKNGTCILTYIGTGNGIGGSYSTNSGQNWSSTVFVPGVTIPDKITSASDNSASSPYFGNTYLVYNEREGINFSKTTNGGMNWTTSQRICPAFSYLRTGASIAIGTQGEIYVTWPYLADSVRHVGFAKSTNGGTTWTSTDNAFPVYPVNTGFRINLNLVKTNGLPALAVDKSGGARNGWLYVICSERNHLSSPALDSCDIVIHCSSNQGATWPMKYRVNQDIGSYKHQTFPAINIDKYGGINVTYYDNRNTPTRDSFQVYMSRSTNGGQTFEDFNISGNKFKLKQLPTAKILFGVPSYIGSYTGITSSENRIIPLWYDNYSGEDYQARTAIIEITPKSYVKVIPEGYYNSVTDRLIHKDTLKFYLRNTLSPYNKVDSSIGVLDSVQFTAEVTFDNNVSGNYYLEVNHRNSVETWSKLPVIYSHSNGLNYDFTDLQSKAYGDNLILKGSRYCIFSGDINKDGIVDPTDMVEIDNDVANFMTGYIITDLNGDLVIDSSDLNLGDNNVYNFISRVIP